MKLYLVVEELIPSDHQIYIVWAENENEAMGPH